MPRLLLIEDEIGAIAALKRMLARSGHEVLVATNLPDALSCVEQEHPDALLVAAGLQGESAASLVEAIRGVDLSRPLIVLGDGSGCGEPFLLKPVDGVRLTQLLGELLPGNVPTPAPSLTPERSPEPVPEPVPEVSSAEAEALRRRAMVAKTLAEAQARRQAAAAARTSTTGPLAPAPKPPTPASRPISQPVAPPSVRRDLPYFHPHGEAAAPPSPSAASPVAVPAPVLDPIEQLAPATPPAVVEQAAHFPQVPAEIIVPVRRSAPDALEIPRSGPLDSLEPAAVLLACHRAHLTGQLQLDQGLVQRVLFFDDGRVAGAASTSPDERLEALSYRRGLISREQQRQLRSETQIPTRRLALVMVERAYLKQAELFPLVQERVEEVIYEACGAFTGSYQILAQSVPDDERVALSRSPLALATEAIRRKYLMDRLLAGLGGPATLLKPARGPELAEYGLTARERRLAQSIDGLRNIEELLFESGSEPLPGLKVLFALLLGRSVEIAMRGAQGDASPELEARIDLTRVAEKYEQVRSANYFEVLGVNASATAYEIEQSYERLAREFQPARFRELRRPELLGQLDEIQRLLAEARDILVDEGLREKYRLHVRR